MKFFPLIFSLFMFICISNLIGIIPYTFTVSSHIIVTAALALTVALTALELLVAFLQAYVFAILTCIYLNDAIHPGH